MSKRLGMGMVRVNGIEGGVKVIPGPMTKGQALIRARGILGPDARVFRVEQDCFVGLYTTHPKYSQRGAIVDIVVTEGKTWEEAIACAAISSHARDWSDLQIDEGNEIEQAKDDLKKTRKKVGEGNFKAFMQGLAEKFQKKEKDKVKHAEEYQLWKEGREEDYQDAVGRSKELAEMSPEARTVYLRNEKFMAKQARRLEYAILGYLP